MGRAELLARLRELLAGSRDDAAVVEAEQLLAELAEAKKPPAPRPPRVVDVEAEERLRWRRLVGTMGASGAGQRVWSPGPQSGHTKGLQRDGFRPWG